MLIKYEICSFCYVGRLIGLRKRPLFVVLFILRILKKWKFVNIAKVFLLDKLYFAFFNV